MSETEREFHRKTALVVSTKIVCPVMASEGGIMLVRSREAERPLRVRERINVRRDGGSIW